MKAKCEICNKQFEQKRTNQIYCSNSCKQKAFKERKVNESKVIDSEEKEILDIGNFMSEAEYIKQNYDGNYKNEIYDLDPILYFFLTRNLINKEGKGNYILSLCGWGTLSLERFRDTTEYKKFESDYLSGKFKIGWINED